MSFFSKLFDPSAGEIKRLNKIVDKIDSFEEEHKALTDEQLRGKTVEFRERLKNGETLDDLLPEAYSVVREATCRVTGKRQFRVQMLGGIVLHQGRIAEMKTGEGKTLTATMPAYLNALTGEGVHIVTVNDYLARRDSEWMGKGYRFLPLGELLSQSEAVFCCLNKNTVLLHEAEFGQLGNKKILFNTGLSPAWDEAPFMKWLEGDNLCFCDTAGALGDSHLLNHPHVRCMQVSTGRTRQAFDRLSEKVLANLSANCK